MFLKSFITSLIVFLSLSVSVYAVDFYWWVGSGDYNNPANWADSDGKELNAVPGPADNVFFGSKGPCSVTFPPGGTYEALSISAQNTTFYFNSTNYGTIDIDVYGDISLHPSVSLIYLNDNTTRWTIVGDENNATNHILDTQGLDMGIIKMGSELSTLELKSDLNATGQILFLGGQFFSGEYNINCGTFFLGQPGYGSNNSVNKIMHIDGSVITCFKSISGTSPGQFFCKYNDIGTVQLIGDYEIKAQSFLIHNIYLQKATLTDYHLQWFLTGSSPSGDFLNASFGEFIIDNEFRSLFLGSFEVGKFEVVNEGSLVSFENNGAEDGDTLTITGTVEMPNGGVCGKLVVFDVEDNSPYFFNRPSGSATFDHVMISNIGATGSGTFAVTNGKVAGNNPTWIQSSQIGSNTFYWYGGTGSWFESSHWSLIPKLYNNPNGCVPGPADNVVFDEFAFTGPGQAVMMDFSKKVMFNDFIWDDNFNDGVIEMDVPIGFTKERLEPTVFGDFSICDNCEIETDVGKGAYKLWFKGNGGINIAKDSLLPYIHIRGTYAYHELSRDLNLANILYLDNGYFKTNHHDIHARVIDCQSNAGGTIHLGQSTLEAPAQVRLRHTIASENTVIGSQASVITENFDCANCTLKSLELSNSTFKNLHYNLTLEKLHLKGAGQVNFSKTGDSLRVDTLIMESGTRLGLSNGTAINGKVVSLADSLDPAYIERYMHTGSGIAKVGSNGPLCIEGFIELADIDYQGDFQIHAPQATDLGDNSGVNFESNDFNNELYWIGQQGEFTDMANWSNIPIGCPTAQLSLSEADTIYFDNSGTSNDDTIRLSHSVPEINHIVVQGKDGVPINNYDLFFDLREPLTARSFTVKNIKSFLIGRVDSTQDNTEVSFTLNLTAEQSAKFYFKDIHLMLGEDFKSLQKPVWVLKDPNTLMIGYPSDGQNMITILGAPVGDTAVYIDDASGMNLTNVNLEVAARGLVPVFFDWDDDVIRSVIFKEQDEYNFTGPMRVRKTMILEKGTITKGEFVVDP